MDGVSKREKENPSFSAILLDEIYRSIDDEESAVCRKTVRKKQSKFGDGFEDDHDERLDVTGLRRACLIEKWMDDKFGKRTVVGRKSAADPERSSLQSERESCCFNSSSSSSDSSCGGGFSSSETEPVYACRPKPIRTSIYGHDEFITREKQRNREHEDSKQRPKHEGKFMKTKSKALKIYTDMKQPISPGGRLATFLNSIFTAASVKKHKISSVSSSGGYGEATRSQLDRKSKSANASTCSSASSFSRSCLNNTPPSKAKLINGIKRSVKFYPVTVIVDEDCQPCGHKSITEPQSDLDKVKFAKTLINDESQMYPAQNVENLLKNYKKKFEGQFESITNNTDKNGDKEDADDANSCSSSDLFELDNLSAIGMDRYQEELPVYESTHFSNRFIR